jgi:hypothetical protein
MAVSKPMLFVSPILAGALLAGCSRPDARLEKLTAGINKDSVQQVMGMEKPRRIDPYLVNGHYIEAMYFARAGADADSIPDRKMSPVVLFDGALVGWGWKQWDSIAAENKIAVQPK